MRNVTKNTLLTIALIITLTVAFAVSASAEAASTVYIRNTKFDPAPGQTFTTTIYVAEGSNLVGIDLSMSYNTDILTLVEYENVSATCTAADGIISIHYASQQNTTSELSLVELTFTVDDSLAAGSFDDWITWTGEGEDEAITYIGIVNGQPVYENLNCRMDLSSLFIRMKGDALNNNNDGKINSRDAVYILQHAAHMFDMPINDRIYANVHEDYEDGDIIPKINTRDAIKILQYIAHMDVVLNDRFNVSFYDIDENGNYVLQVVKSVASGGTLQKIPSVVVHDGYENGVWSLEKVDSSLQAVLPDYTNVQQDISVYAVYDYTGRTAEGKKLYQEVADAIDNVFMEEGKYIADDFQLPYKNAVDVYNMPSYADYDVTWGTESGLLAQGLSVSGYIVDVPQVDYTTWVKFTATVLIDEINYGTVSFDREIKGTIDLPSPDEFKKIVDAVPVVIDEAYRLPGYVSLESGRMNYGVNLVQNVDIKWDLISGNAKGYDADNYAFIHLKDENAITLRANFIFDNRVVASYIIERTIPAKTLEGQKEYALEYLSSFVPSALGSYYMFPAAVERYDFSVSWFSGSPSGKFDLTKENVEYNNAIYQQIGVGPTAEYMEIGYLVARIERDGEKVEEFTFTVQIVGDSDTVNETRFGDVRLYNKLLDIFGIDDGEGGKKLTEESLTGYLDIGKYINSRAVSNYQSSNNSIDLTNLGLTSLKGIQYLKSVKILKVSGNNFESAETSGLEYLASLTKLEQIDLSHCEITRIPSGLLLNMYNIEGINLSYNNLTDIDFMNVDRALYSLSDLFVHENDLINIEGLIYDNGTGKDGVTIYQSTVPNIKRLTLSRKADSAKVDEVLDITPISYAKNLAVLWVANHNISDISSLASCKYLETLDLSNNDIYAPNSTNDALESISNLTCLKKLVLDDNRIATVRSLRKLTNLEYLSMANNNISNLSTSLSQIDGLTVLNLNGNKLTTFEASYFPALTYLYLENNLLSQISGLPTLAPIDETENTPGKTGLIELRLSGNVIDAGTVEEAGLYLPYIKQLTGLKYLSLSGNNVGKLEFLSALTNLTHLELADANICQTYQTKDYDDPITDEPVMKEVDNLTNLYNLTSLVVLDLSGNEELTDISALATASGGLRRLQYLYLDKKLGVKSVVNDQKIYYEYKPITNLSSLRNMPQLYALSIQNSGLTDIGFVSQIGAVEYLNLAGHSIESIDLSVFRGKEDITHLFLDSTVGSDVINAECLEDVINIVALSLENIKFSDVGVLPDWESIEYLNLSHTAITDFAGEDEDFTSVNRFKNSLKVLDISGNNAVFTKHNLNHLYDSYIDAATVVYLYDDHAKPGFDSAREALTIQQFLKDVPVTSESNRRKIHTFYDASENVDGPFALQNTVNEYSLTWTVDNEWFNITENQLCVHNWDMKDDQTLTLYAGFDVYDHDGTTDSVSMSVYVAPSPYTIRKYEKTATGTSFDETAYTDELGLFNIGIQALSPTSLDGYTFDGWFTQMYGNGSHISGGFINQAITPEGDVSDVTVYAKWLYDVRYSGNGGQLHNAADDNPHTYISNEGVILPGAEYLPTKTGYSFDYWYVSDETEKFEDGTITSNTTLNAKWYYTINYDANGGVLQDVESQKYDEFGEIVLPEAPTRTGYTFAGWLCEENDSIAENGNILCNMTLKAQWEANNYTVRYNSNLGTGDIDDSVHVYDSKSNLVRNSFERPGFSFDHWNTEPDNTGSSYEDGQEILNLSAVFDDTVHLYAIWEPISYTIVYNANGGEGNMSDSVRTYGTEGSLSPVAFTKTGYKFEGWALTPDGEPICGDEEPGYIAMPSQQEDGTYVLTLYAVWTVNACTVTYELNSPLTVVSPSCSSLTATLTYDLPYKLAVPQCSYYVFEGWYTAAVGGTQLTDKSGYSLYNSSFIGTAKVYAHWSKQYTATYIYNRSGLEAIKNNMSAEYMLICDINLSNSAWSMLGEFKGKLNGNGHKIIGLNYTGVLANGGANYGFFESLTGAQVLNINFTNVSINTDNDSNNGGQYFIGTLASTATTSSISNISVSGSVKFTGSYGGSVFAGGIVGKATSCTFTSCKNSAEIMASKGAANAGGIAGTASGTETAICYFNSCNNSGAIKAQLMVFLGNARAGGIVGYCPDRYCSFDGSTNNGTRKAWGDAGNIYAEGDIYNS